ncbi:MAG TPA: flagellar biosynthesis protein [Rubrivivax sp.]
MNDFYAHSRPAPLDQADGLRRIFAGSPRRFLALASNPHAPFSGIALERLTATLALLGRKVLVVDAADGSPAASEAAALEIAPCIEQLSPTIAYLAARGLPLRFVNTRGSSARLLDELAAAAPQCGVVLVHASAADLARLFTQRTARPLLLASDHPESVKHAYASMKLLAQRCGWLSADLLLVAPPHSPRLPQIASTLASCADTFIGAALTAWSAVDPAGAASEAPCDALRRLIEAQLGLDDERTSAPAWPARTNVANVAPSTPHH